MYKRQGQGSVEKYHDIHVVYTKEAETADAYIERATYEIGRRHRVRVATSDGPEQLIILGHGALRLSASAFQMCIRDSRRTARRMGSPSCWKRRRSMPVGTTKTGQRTP